MACDPRFVKHCSHNSGADPEGVVQGGTAGILAYATKGFRGHLPHFWGSRGVTCPPPWIRACILLGYLNESHTPLKNVFMKEFLRSQFIHRYIRKQDFHNCDVFSLTSVCVRGPPWLWRVMTYPAEPRLDSLRNPLQRKWLELTDMYMYADKNSSLGGLSEPLSCYHQHCPLRNPVW